MKMDVGCGLLPVVIPRDFDTALVHSLCLENVRNNYSNFNYVIIVRGQLGHFDIITRPWPVIKSIACSIQFLHNPAENCP